MESQYESLVRLSASLSPPCIPIDDGKANEKHSRSRRSRTVEAPEIDLSRASPFGSLSQGNARRTFAYLIATLNASHPDYDFSHLLRPSDFRKERSLRGIMHNLDSTLQHLRPRQTVLSNYLAPLSLSVSAPGPGSGSDIWNPNMWRLLDKEMGLRQCEKYSYTPEDDPFDDEEGAIWSMHYFFFNKEKKRVCYIYLRAFSVISHSPAAMGARKGKPVQRKVSSLSIGEGAGKRASFWLSNEMLQRSIDTVSYGEDDDDEMILSEADECEVPYMDLDDVRSSLIDGRFSYPIDEDEDISYDETDDQFSSREVRGMSEEIGAAMDIA